MEMKSPMRKHKWPSYGWWLLKTVVINLIVLECMAWVVLEIKGGPEYTYYASYMNSYKYHPYVAFHPAQFPVYSNVQDKKSPDLAILGGSTAAGVGPRRMDDAYFRFLEKAMAEKGAPITMVNYAAPGYVSNQEEAVYKNFIYPGPPPRLVLSLTGFNDIYFYLFRTLPVGNHEFNYAFDHVFRQGYPNPKSYLERFANFCRRSNIYGFFHQAISRQPIQLSSEIFDPTQPNYPIPIPEERLQAAVGNFLRNVEATALLAKSRGSKYVVILQPIIYYGGKIEQKPNEWFSEIRRLQSWVAEVGTRKPDYDRFFSLVIPGLESLKKHGLLDYLDYRAAISGPVFRDPVHFNEQASEALGRKMAAAVFRFLHGGRIGHASR